MAASKGRPEDAAPPEVWYNASEAAKYTSSTRMRSVQSQLSQRCFELLALPPDRSSLLLDVGCGSCLSMAHLPERTSCIGIDISGDMLDVGIDEGNCEGNALLGDVGQGLPLVDQCVDGVISVSAVQWLCNADTSASDPRKRLLTFFRELYRVLQRGCRAALQFYPASESQANLIVKQAIRAGFSGGIVVDFPNSTKAKKQFLVITAGAADPAKTQQAVKQQQQQQQKGQDDGEDEEQMQVVGGGADVESMQVEVGKRELTANGNEQKHEKEKKGKKPKAGKQWVLQKKERHKRVGKEVKSDSKYSGRKRKRKPI